MQEAETIRPAGSSDAADLARIYSHYVETTTITFEEQAVGAEDMRARLRETDEASLPWLVAEVDGSVAGFAYASPWKGRCAYRHSAEVTVYLEPGRERRGLGSALYGELLERLAASGYRVAIGGIALPNEASVALHERLGFERVGVFREVGFKFGRWIDVGYWQKTLTSRARHPR